MYLKAYENARQAQISLQEYFKFYNQQRRHQSLKRQTPDFVYYQAIDIDLAA